MTLHYRFIIHVSQCDASFFKFIVTVNLITLRIMGMNYCQNYELDFVIVSLSL